MMELPDDFDYRPISSITIERNGHRTAKADDKNLPPYKVPGITLNFEVAISDPNQAEAYKEKLVSDLINTSAGLNLSAKERGFHMGDSEKNSHHIFVTIKDSDAVKENNAEELGNKLAAAIRLRAMDLKPVSFSNNASLEPVDATEVTLSIDPEKLHINVGDIRTKKLYDYVQRLADATGATGAQFANTPRIGDVKVRLSFPDAASAAIVKNFLSKPRVESIEAIARGEIPYR